MSEKWLCPRLVDYLVVVGSRSPHHQASIQIPELLRRYPVEDHKDFPLPLDVVFFCQPEGCVSAGPKRPSLRDAVSFVFTLTDKDSGKTRYGVCLNFYRSTERTSCSLANKKNANDSSSSFRRQSWRKSAERSSDSAFSSDQKSGFVHSDSDRDCTSRRDSEATPCSSTLTVGSRLSVNPLGNDSESGGSQSPSPRAARRRQRQKSHSLTSLCILSHHPFFSSFRQCLALLKRLIDVCQDNISRRSGASKSGSRDNIWNILTGDNIESPSPVILHDVKEIETWILRFLSSPVPVPGATKLELEVFPPDIHPPLIFALPDKTRFSLTDFPLHLPLELLGVDSCLQVLTLILLECKVVIQSRDYSALSMSVLALVTMLYPLEYMFPVIPLLPTCMSSAEQLLLAPTPYIIGIPASFLPYKKHFRLPNDVWLVDLDANKISGPKNVDKTSTDFIPSLPDPETSILRNHLKQALTSMSSAPFPELKVQSGPTQIEPAVECALPSPSASDASFTTTRSESSFLLQTRKGSDDNEPRASTSTSALSPAGKVLSGSSMTPSNSFPQGRHPTSFNPLIYGNDVDSVDVATRIAMVRFFNAGNMLANFSEHTRTLRLYPRPVVAFQINSFLRSRPNPPSQFLCRFARTQAVEYLAEWTLAPTNLAFLRVQTGVFDPAIIGDKPKWFAHTLEAIRFVIYHDTPGLCSMIRNAQKISAPPTDESGSDSEGGESGESSSSYSSLSDFVSELASSDWSPSGTAVTSQQIATQEKLLQEYEQSQALRAGDRSWERNITSLCSSLDLSTVYSPPSCLQYAEEVEQEPARRRSRSSSGSDSDSSTSSATDDRGSSRRESAASGASGTRKSSQTKEELIEEEVPSTIQPGSSKLEHVKQGGLLGHIASQAKELVKETKRQSSQEGLFSQVDKIKTKTKERLSEVARQGSSTDEANFLSPFEQMSSKITNHAKRAAEEAGRSVQAGLSKKGLDDITSAGKHTWGDFTKSAKKGILKSLGDSLESKDKEKEGEWHPKDTFERSDSASSSASPKQPPIPQIKEEAPKNSGRDFFFNMSSEINGLANQTSSMFSDLFGANRSSVSACPTPIRANSPVPSLASSTGSLPSAVMRSNARDSNASLHAHGPFPTGKKGLVERSSLIRHTTAHLHPKKGGSDLKMMQKIASHQALKTTSVENQAFLSEVANHVLIGEGVGWLKVGRLKKLFEDESYRVMMVAKVNQTLDKKVGPDDHIDDVIVSKPIWKGLLKVLQIITSGLEHSYANRSLGGMASAFQVLEIAHTHYWSKDINDMGGDQAHQAQFLDPNAVSPGMSAAGSPVSSAHASPDPSRRPSAQSCEQGDPNTEQSHHNVSIHASTDAFKDILQSKKQSLIARLSSSETHIEGHDTDTVQGQPQSNVVMNPSWPPQVLNLSAVGKPKLSSRLSQMSLRSTVSDTELEQGSGRGKRSPSVWSSKSALAAGLRYHAGSLIPTGSSPTSPENGRMYLFEGLLKERSALWDQMQFWEDAFLDAVAQERELVGMDQGPREMMDRYLALSDSEKKRLEHEEDRLLATQLYNLVAYMLMMDVARQEVKQKIRRLLGKSHMGLVYSQEINQLLEQITHLRGNAVDLKPAGSRLAHRQTFAVHAGSEPIGDLLFMEVRDDGIVLRNVSGAIVERWWWESLINMTYSPKAKVLCLWRKNGGQTQLHKYHSRKCKQLYQAIKEAMERAAARGNAPLPGTDLGGEFPVEDLKTGQGGLLQVCMEGVGLLFANSKFFVRLDHIRKCFTQKGGIFVLEEYNPKSRQVIQRRFKSTMADNICYSVLCVFSYVAAGQEHKKRSIAQSSSSLQVERGAVASPHYQ